MSWLGVEKQNLT